MPHFPGCKRILFSVRGWIVVAVLWCLPEQFAVSRLSVVVLRQTREPIPREYRPPASFPVARRIDQAAAKHLLLCSRSAHPDPMFASYSHPNRDASEQRADVRRRRIGEAMLLRSEPRREREQ